MKFLEQKRTVDGRSTPIHDDVPHISGCTVGFEIRRLCHLACVADRIFGHIFVSGGARQVHRSAID